MFDVDATLAAAQSCDCVRLSQVHTYNTCLPDLQVQSKPRAPLLSRMRLLKRYVSGGHNCCILNWDCLRSKNASEAPPHLFFGAESRSCICSLLLCFCHQGYAECAAERRTTSAISDARRNRLPWNGQTRASAKQFSMPKRIGGDVNIYVRAGFVFLRVFMGPTACCAAFFECRFSAKHRHAMAAKLINRWRSPPSLDGEILEACLKHMCFRE